MRLRRPLQAIAVALALAGCATGEVRPGAENPETVTQSINLSGYPPEFQEGFKAGCAAARARGKAERPPSGGQYAVGWNDGFDYCSRKN